MTIMLAARVNRWSVLACSQVSVWLNASLLIAGEPPGSTVARRRLAGWIAA
jgi:hypothetical protein